MALGYAFNKDYLQTNHAVRRAWERYSIKFTAALNNRIGMMIAAGAIKGTRYSFSRYEVFEFDWRLVENTSKPLTVKIAYDDQTGNVATFLPQHWTPESGMEHFETGRDQRAEAGRLASLEVARAESARALASFGEVHPDVVPVDDPVAHRAALIAAMTKLQSDRDTCVHFRLLKTERLASLNRRITEAKRSISALKQQKLADAAKDRKAAKAAAHDLRMSQQANRVPIDEVIDGEHALRIAIDELVGNETLKLAILGRAKKLRKRIKTAA